MQPKRHRGCAGPARGHQLSASASQHPAQHTSSKPPQDAWGAWPPPAHLVALSPCRLVQPTGQSSLALIWGAQPAISTSATSSLICAGELGSKPRRRFSCLIFTCHETIVVGRLLPPLSASLGCWFGAPTFTPSFVSSPCNLFPVSPHLAASSPSPATIWCFLHSQHHPEGIYTQPRCLRGSVPDTYIHLHVPFQANPSHDSVTI